MLFYGFFVAFIIITPIVLAYAIGYSIDIRGRSFTPAGGIFLKTNQTGIRVFIDGKYTGRKDTSFLSSGVLFNNLRAGTYRVRIEKTGFRPWEKDIEVTRQVVSEYRNIFLIPEEVPVRERREVVRIGAFEYFPSPDGNHIALSFSKGTILTIERAKDHAILLRREFQTPFEHVEWLNAETLVLKTAPRGDAWLAIELAPQERIVQTPIRILENKRVQFIERVMKRPTNAGEFFALSEGGVLFRYAAQKSTSLLRQVVHAAIVSDRILFVTDNGFLATADFDGKQIAVLGRPGFFLRGEFKTYSGPNGTGALIDGVGGIFLFDIPNQKVMPFPKTAEKVSFHQKGILSLVQNPDELSVLFIAPEDEAPFRAESSLVMVLSHFPERIIDSAWYGERYILFTTEQGLYGAEFGNTSDDAAIVNKLSSVSGFIFINNSLVTLINDKGTYVLAIE